MSLSSLSSIQTFPDYTPAAYLAASGQQPPAPNPTRRLKTWFDPSAAGKTSVSYQVLDQTTANSANPKLTMMTLTGVEASTVNLPEPLVTFPPYVIADTQATFELTAEVGSSVPPTKVNANNLSTQDQANGLVGLIPGGKIIQPSANNQFFTYVWGSEARRDYAIVNVAGNWAYVGALISAMNAHGVGAPGGWDPAQLALGNFAWIFTVVSTNVDTSQPACPEPLTLPAGSQLVGQLIATTILGPQYSVMVSDSGPLPVVNNNVSGCAVNPADVAQIKAQVEFIYKLSGGQ